MSEPTSSISARHRRTVPIGRLVVVAVVVLVVVVAGYATYAAYLDRSPGGNTTLVVYTYSSLLGGDCGGPSVDALLLPFEAAHNVSVRIVCPAGTLVSTLLAQAAAPVADVVIGLDEITGPEAEAHGLLVPNAAPPPSGLDPTIASELSPDGALAPYEWGYLALDYNLSFAAATGGAVAHADLATFATNASWARGLMVEDPTVDITGEEFLLWEIAYAQSVLHEDWTNWWSSVDPYVQVAPDWSTAYAAFLQPTGAPSTVVSYTTDPASSAYYGAPGAFNATVANHNGSAYGWRTVYGAGVVAGSAHTGLAADLVAWLLSPTVQAAIPTTEWEYPTNDSAPLPPEYAYALPPEAIVPLNGALPASMIVASLPGWLETWQSLANGAAA